MFSRVGRAIISCLDFITKYFKTFVFLTLVAFVWLGNTNHKVQEPNLAKLYLYGPIFESESFADQIDKIKQNPSIKGVLLIIDSPGGSISASVELSDMVAHLAKKMPVVAYVRGVMASGSYYAGMVANKIYANRGALVGSIGVIFSGMNIAPLMDKLGIKAQGMSKGAYKEVGTFTRAWTSQEKQYLDALLGEQYGMFVSDVAKARHLNPKDAPKFAEGKIFSAKRALELKLIDHVGTYEEAVVALQDLSAVKKPVWLQRDKLEMLMDKVLKSSTQALVQVLGYQLR
ncbi:signal peptide peptidase SppA [Helicobacter bizzozeronii]|uniref:signal peptide peptidase SppA n=1 Tax=Helicobacter bizzozeronii TaxID=56877 RepID=UPI000CF1B77D|nr:signal peptide peptidase SppA [Helicobacter bizzozeronii]